MTATFSETPPVYSVIRTEQPVNPGYPTQMRKFKLNLCMIRTLKPIRIMILKTLKMHANMLNKYQNIPLKKSNDFLKSYY